jgi:hypothetical protein
MAQPHACFMHNTTWNFLLYLVSKDKEKIHLTPIDIHAIFQINAKENF